MSKEDNEIKDEMRNIISNMEKDERGKINPSKLECKKLCELRIKIEEDYYNDDCFCGRSSRIAFLSEINNWL